MAIDSSAGQVLAPPAPIAADANAEIVARMHAHARKFAETGETDLPTCASGFTVSPFAVTYPNNELVAIATVTAVPDGVVFQGVTVVGTPSENSSTTYAMASAANSAGLALPVAVSAASTSPSFPSATPVTGMVIITYTQDGTQTQCGMTQSFTIG